MRNRVLAVLVLLGPTAALLSVAACGSTTPSTPPTASSVSVDTTGASTSANAVPSAPTADSGNQAQAQAMYTLAVTLDQGYHLGGPFAANLSGPNGFTCYMSQSQVNVTCPVVSYSAGTNVQITLTISTPATANGWPIYETVGCDVTTMSTCSVRMNENRTVLIKAGRG